MITDQDNLTHPGTQKYPKVPNEIEVLVWKDDQAGEWEAGWRWVERGASTVEQISDPDPQTPLPPYS